MQIIEMTKEMLDQYIDDDPVRPHLPTDFRINHEFGRRAYCLVDVDLQTGIPEVKAIVCVANGFSIPTTEAELSKIPYAEKPKQSFMIPYTIWSYGKGAGRTLLNGLLNNLKKEIKRTKQKSPRVVTMSPKTELATKFHLSNGAKLISENKETDNFEYNVS
jgi:hypothetical protein